MFCVDRLTDMIFNLRLFLLLSISAAQHNFDRWKCVQVRTRTKRSNTFKDFTNKLQHGLKAAAGVVSKSKEVTNIIENATQSLAKFQSIEVILMLMTTIYHKCSIVKGLFMFSGRS